jgi:hypothetical protein
MPGEHTLAVGGLCGGASGTHGVAPFPVKRNRGGVQPGSQRRVHDTSLKQLAYHAKALSSRLARTSGIRRTSENAPSSRPFGE